MAYTLGEGQCNALMPVGEQAGKFINKPALKATVLAAFLIILQPQIS